MARRSNRLQVKIDENVSRALLSVEKSIKETKIKQALHEGAQLIAGAVRAAAPDDTGVLREGVHVASALGDEYRPLYRRHGKRNMVSKPLKRKVGPNQALVRSSVFYGAFVQRGRSSAAKTGATKPNPFFARGLRKSRQRARQLIQQQIEALLKESWR